jgi:hypothetical protein
MYTGRVLVTGPDPYELDDDSDGVGCDRAGDQDARSLVTNHAS